MYGDKIKILVTGSDGQIGRAFCRAVSKLEQFEIIAFNRRELDVTDQALIEAKLAEELPHYVLNGAGFNYVDAAEAHPHRAFAINGEGPLNLAKACHDLSIPLIHISSDYVFDGHYESGYTETDEPAPLGAFGASKLQGEANVREHLAQHIILRISWVFSENGTNYLTKTLEKARNQTSISAVDDRRGCPTAAHDVARVILAIIQQLEEGADHWGTYHYSGAEITTRYRFTEAIIAAAGQYEALKVSEITPIPGSEESGAERPTSSVLTCKKILNTFGIRQRPWRVDLQRLVREVYGKDGSKVIQPTVETRAEELGS